MSVLASYLLCGCFVLTAATGITTLVPVPPWRHIGDLGTQLPKGQGNGAEYDPAGKGQRHNRRWVVDGVVRGQYW